MAVQSCAGRPPVAIWVTVARPAVWRARSAWSIWPAGWLCLSVSLIWLRVRPAGLACERGVDLFGERLAGRAGQRPGGGAGGVVVERERGVEVLRADLPLAVGEGVEEREADRVRFGAGGDLAERSPGWGWASWR